MKTLAIHGGTPAVTLKYPPHPVIGNEEKVAVAKVFERNQFSEFIASKGKNFLGGTEIRAFEELVARDTKCKYGVAYNSWTSGLHAAVAACGTKSFDKVLVTPYSFTSSATCALMNNCTPIFVDVDDTTCMISPETLNAAVKQYPDAKVLVLVHLFGMPADIDPIISICEEHDIKIIEDCAQAPGAIYKGEAVGGIGHCGGFSFTQSKCISSGEGGMLVTNDSHIASIARMVRNHGEATEYGKDRTYDSQFLGMGYRMTEISAAIGRQQWLKLDEFNKCRTDLNKNFKEFILNSCDFIKFQDAPYDHKHVYYVTPMLFDNQKAGVSRAKFAAALKAEGVNIMEGYIKPLYKQSLYQNRAHLALQNINIDYSDGICPNAEDLHYNKFMMMMDLRPPMGDDLLGQIKEAFSKVIDNVGWLGQ